MLQSILLVFALVGSAPFASNRDTLRHAVAWGPVLDRILEILAARHPDAFARVGRRQFQIGVDALRRELPREDDATVTVRLMQLVASLQDGHTQLEPVRDTAFAHWFPVRFYAFADGLYITAIDRPHQAIVGTRVTRIGDLAADEALRRAETVMGADNAWGQRENSFALSNATMLHAMGISPDPHAVTLEVEQGGTRRKVRLESVHVADGSFDGRFRGEMFPPFRNDSIPWVTAFAGRAPRDFRVRDSRLPLHLRYRLHYFCEPVNDGLYVQINFMANADSQSFEQFTDSVFHRLDRNPVRKLVIDLRYNSGGNGDLVPRFADALKVRAPRPPWRQLYVLLGPKTFSAAIMLAHGIQASVPDAVTVGEPSGAGYNSFGDPMDFEIEGTGLRLSVSTLYHQLGRFDDFRPYIPVNLPAVMTARDYFAGRDPPLELVLGNDETRSLTALLGTDGPAAATAAFLARESRYGGLAWWEPFSERSVNTIGYEMLRDGNREGAAATFALNTLAYPASWNTWDSYGEALALLGHAQAARNAYQRSLTLNPGNASARTYLESHSP